MPARRWRCVIVVVGGVAGGWGDCHCVDGSWSEGVASCWVVGSWGAGERFRFRELIAGSWVVGVQDGSVVVLFEGTFESGF